MGAFIKDEHALAKGKVRYVGEPVAAVAAETEAQARAAAAAIEVDLRGIAGGAHRRKRRLRRTPPSFTSTPAEYIKVFDAGTDGNLCSRTSFREGDVERGWRESDVIVEGELPDAGRRRMSRSSRAARWPKSMPTAASRCGRRTSRCSASRPTSASRSACRCRGCAA